MGLSVTLQAVALSADTETAYCFATDRIYAWNVLTGEKLREFAPQSSHGAFAGSAGRAVTLGLKKIQLWNISNGELIETRPLDVQQDRQTKMLMAGNGELAVVATRDKSLKILSLPPVPPPEGLMHSFSATTPIHSLDLSPDSVWAAGGGEGTLFVWNLLHPPASYTLKSPSLISAVQFSPRGDYLAYGTGENNSKINHVGVRELTDNLTERFVKKATDWRKLSGFNDAITSLSWDHTGSYLIASSDDGSVRAWDPQNDQIKASIQHPEPVSSFVNIPNESLVLFANGHDAVQSWRWSDSRGTAAESTDSIPHATHIAVSSAETDLIAIATRDGRITLLQRQSGNSIALPAAEYDPVAELCFIPDSRSLASGHASGAVRVWDVDQSREMKRFSSGNAPITAIEATPDGRYIVAASLVGTVNVWHVP